MVTLSASLPTTWSLLLDLYYAGAINLLKTSLGLGEGLGVGLGVGLGLGGRGVGSATVTLDKARSPIRSLAQPTM